METIIFIAVDPHYPYDAPLVWSGQTLDEIFNKILKFYGEQESWLGGLREEITRRLDEDGYGMFFEFIGRRWFVTKEL